MAAWPYRMDLDWVVEAPDGRLAANCLIWYDEANGAARSNRSARTPTSAVWGWPVPPAWRALRALRDLGGTSAVVCSYETADNPGPAALYRGLGFRDVTRRSCT